jgi:hypothetical protein
MMDSMRRLRLALASTLVLAVVAFACLAFADEADDIIDLLLHATPDGIRAAARRTAEADIAAERLRVAFAGGDGGAEPVGFPLCAPYPEVFGLPAVPLPFEGCTNALGQEVATYAKAYNEVMGPYILLRETDADREELAAWVKEWKQNIPWCTSESFWRRQPR